MRRRTLSMIACVACLVVAGGVRHTTADQQPAPVQQPGAAPGAPLPALAPATVSPAAMATPPEITIQDTPAGSLFADRKGFTLYVTERDREQGKSTCFGACAEQWVPLRAEADTKPFGDWSLVPREDGRPQWAYQGRPLYRYRWEAKPRWAEAHNEVWRYASVVNFPPVGAGRRGYTPGAAEAKIVLPPSPGGVTGNPTKFGIAFSDAKNLTLYTQATVSPCTGECLDSWIPLAAPQAASPIGEWTIVTRNDGARQWAYQGRPVYRSVKDTKPGDASGVSETWHAALVPSDKPRAQAAPARASSSTPSPKPMSRGTTAEGQKPAGR